VVRIVTTLLYLVKQWRLVSSCFSQHSKGLSLDNGRSDCANLI